MLRHYIDFAKEYTKNFEAKMKIGVDLSNPPAPMTL
jgi:hypothetical protein